MKLKEIKTAREFKLPNVRVEFVTEGTALKEIILYPEGSTTSYSLKTGPSYTETVKVFERVMFEQKTVHRIAGTVLGLRVQQDFDDPKEASKRIDELRDQDPDLILNVYPVNVIVDDAGDAVKEDDGIPF